MLYVTYEIFTPCLFDGTKMAGPKYGEVFLLTPTQNLLEGIMMLPSECATALTFWLGEEALDMDIEIEDYD